MTDLILYRAHRPAWAFAPLSGDGAAVNGGRWNAKGIPTMYLAADPVTAIAEYQQDLFFRPVTLAEYTVSEATLADLRTASSRSALSVPADTMGLPWRAITKRGAIPESWTVAERLTASGRYHGLLYHSKINGGTCAAIWSWNDGSGCEITVSDFDSDLPKNQSSW